MVCFVWFNVFFSAVCTSFQDFFVIYRWHSVEDPSMRVPHLDISRWGSSWIFHTLSWSAVHCEWGTTSVCLGNNYACSAPGGLPVINRGPKCQHKKIIIVRGIIWISPSKFMKKIMQIQTLNGCYRTNIDEVGNIFYWGFSLVSLHNLLEVPLGVINASNT